MKPELNKNGEYDAKPRSFNEIVVVITLEDYEPMIFRFSRKLSDELQKEREEFYGLNNDEQKVRTREFRINQLSQMLLELPQNVPGVENDANFRESIKQFFTDYPEYINWIWGQYQTKLYPKEILLSLSD